MNKRFILVVLLLVACGKNRQHEFHFETRELSATEIQQYGYGEDSQETAHSVGAGESEERMNETTATALVNATAGVVQKLLAPGESRTVATLIGQAIPKGVRVFDLSKGKPGTHVYEKKLTSPLGFSVVKIHYSVDYQYGAKHNGKGAYLTNVKFIPLRVETDVLWSLRAESLSEEPVNVGTRAEPNARLGFSLTFTAKGLGTRTVTDEFELEASTGALKETIRPFEPN